MLPWRAQSVCFSQHHPPAHDAASAAAAFIIRLCSNRAQLTCLKSVKVLNGVFPFAYGSAYKCYHGCGIRRKLVTCVLRIIPCRENSILRTSPTPLEVRGTRC